MLPNLGRAWYYLSQIDSTNELLYLNRSSFLDQGDYLPPFKIAEYYYKNNDEAEAVPYYVKSLLNYSNLRSNHYMKFVDWNINNTFYNDIIPDSMLHEMAPNINPEEIYEKLISFYESKEQKSSPLFSKA